MKYSWAIWKLWKDDEMAIDLAPYGISYEPRRVVKAQALVNFIAKCLILDESKVEDSNCGCYMVTINN